MDKMIQKKILNVVTKKINCIDFLRMCNFCSTFVRFLGFTKS